MPLDVAAIQASLTAAGLDGWLLYDFHGSNPIAQSVAGMLGAPKMTTRRWYYFIPAQGEPQGLVHAVERHNLDHLPGTMRPYAGRRSLDEGLDALLSGRRRVAMEYSPGCNIPYLSRVDAGTLEAVRQRGVEVVSSGDLVQQFEAVWSAVQIATHEAASAALHRIKDRAFDVLRQVAAGSLQTTEYALQQQMVGWFAEEGLVSSDPPVVAAMANAGNPHYLPTADAHQPIGRNQLVLLDLWGKQGTPGAVYADITWVAYTGASVPDDMARAFDAIARARDAAVQRVQAALDAGGHARGFELDQAAREVLIGAGYADAILHRTGHSLGESVHGNGAHLDDYETRDERQLLDGSGFTIEPGLYFPTFGVRTEINVVIRGAEARVSGPCQGAITALAG
ncbi:peptidase M24 [Luteitalea sp. TBR-22]|uniref:M24 family metallopeptidase n=1 Tax=Luteitalea sp. TBR-22 TaxID=2802971 RepID=UPI001AF323CB|nr:M24 family metallopeptidase [Luteitalea sp. TBR-22]BCS34518.1 peptidase M24 [Luteitalea sp. TBR-22]